MKGLEYFERYGDTYGTQYEVVDPPRAVTEEFSDMEEKDFEHDGTGYLA